MWGIRELMIRVILLVVRLIPVLTWLTNHICLVIVEFFPFVLLIVPNRLIRWIKSRWFGFYPLVDTLIDRSRSTYIIFLLFLVFYIIYDFNRLCSITLFNFLYFFVGLFSRWVSFLFLVSRMVGLYLCILYTFWAVLYLFLTFGWFCLIHLSLKFYHLYHWPGRVLPHQYLRTYVVEIWMLQYTIFIIIVTLRKIFCSWGSLPTFSGSGLMLNRRFLP